MLWLWVACLVTLQTVSLAVAWSPHTLSSQKLPRDVHFRNLPIDLPHQIQVIEGVSLWKITKDLCGQVSYEECVELTYGASFMYYGMPYVPSRPHSCIEDFYYQRKDLITYLTQRFHLTSYLEIGCDQNQTFGEINSLFERAVCVDPAKGGTMRMTSDQFFEQNTETFDVIFIDGLHQAPQVWSDVVNSLSILNENGFILLHDLNPLLEKFQTPEEPPYPIWIWNGDCWKVAIAIQLIQEVELVVGDFDHGVGILRRRPNQHPLPKEWADRIFAHMAANPSPESFLESISFEEFSQNREVLYRMMTVAEVKVWLEE